MDPTRGGAGYIGHDSIILGEEEPVGLSTGKYEESTEVLAKIDTGARYSSIDRALAKKRGADLKNSEDRVEIEFSFGDKVRPLVRVRIKVAEKNPEHPRYGCRPRRALEEHVARQQESRGVHG